LKTAEKKKGKGNERKAAFHDVRREDHQYRQRKENCDEKTHLNLLHERNEGKERLPILGGREGKILA